MTKGPYKQTSVLDVVGILLLIFVALIIALGALDMSLRPEPPVPTVVPHINY